MSFEWFRSQIEYRRKNHGNENKQCCEYIKRDHYDDNHQKDDDNHQKDEAKSCCAQIERDSITHWLAC